MADKIGKYKVSKQEAQQYEDKLNITGGTLAGALTASVEQSAVLIDGPLIQLGEANLQIQNDNNIKHVLTSLNSGADLSIFNSAIVITDAGIGIGQGSPKATVHIGGGFGEELRVSGHISGSTTKITEDVTFLGLPTTEPLTTGSLWVSGSGGGAASGSGYVMVAGIKG